MKRKRHGRKSAPADIRFKAFDADVSESGEISGYFSTYNDEPDCYGDVVAPGAFSKTIALREACGHPFPLCWNHDLDKIVGVVESIEDDETGPHFVATFLDTPLAQEKREIVKSGVVYQFSFAYDVVESAQVTLPDGSKANELRELQLYEISIVPVPANPNAVMTDVKGEKPRAAKGDEDDEETIRKAIDLLSGLLTGDGRDNDSAEDPDQAKAKAEEPGSDNAGEKSRLLELISKNEEKGDSE